MPEAPRARIVPAPIGRIHFATVIAVVAVVAWGLAFDAARAQDQLPSQVLYLPLPTDPDPESGRTPVSAGIHAFELPDGRRAQWIRVQWWTRRSKMHAVRLSIDYAGIESREQFRYGGGRAEAQYAARFDGVWPGVLATDLAVTAPIGDATLHPLSAKAPALRGRLRVRPVAVGATRLWVGVWGRLVSPPGDDDVRAAPLEDFPSGYGIDAALGWRSASWGTALVARQAYGDLPRETTLTAQLDRTVTADLALRLGGGLSIGPRGARLFDQFVAAALVWRPVTARPTDREDRR